MGRWAHLYETPRWRKMRAQHLREHPCCVMCMSLGFDTPALIVDHRQPHRGDTRQFFDPSNLQSLCKLHHDSVKLLLFRVSASHVH
jgi:5-methylcytosine-specific restriction enzyme A